MYSRQLTAIRNTAIRNTTIFLYTNIFDGYVTALDN